MGEDCLADRANGPAQEKLEWKRIRARRCLKEIARVPFGSRSCSLPLPAYVLSTTRYSHHAMYHHDNLRRFSGLLGHTKRVALYNGCILQNVHAARCDFDHWIGGGGDNMGRCEGMVPWLTGLLSLGRDGSFGSIRSRCLTLC